MNTDKDTNTTVSRALLEFIDRAPTPFHAVAETAALLEKDNFTALNEEDAWDLKPGAKHYVTRNGSSLVAFVVGMETAATAGFRIIGAHTDSPNLRLKPNPVYQNGGYVQLGVEVYGGVLLATWTDRDLSLAGRAILRRGAGTQARLVKFDEPLLRVPQLAIHLNREVNTKGLILNKQTHLPPIFTLSEGRKNPEAALTELIADKLGCAAKDILGLELMLHDVQKSSLAGPAEEFVFAPRLDNLASCHAATCALLDAPAKTPATRVLAFYDHEEVGSETAQGGGSPFLKNILERLTADADKPREAFMRAMARSVFISADMAHAVHPNYADQHDAQHMPVINRGPVIKSNAGQKYATEGMSSAAFEILCERAGVPVQKFVVRSDLACGSTIGPITAANLGIQTVDVGNPMLSMHSIREMAGSADHAHLIRAFLEFFKPE